MFFVFCQESIVCFLSRINSLAFLAEQRLFYRRVLGLFLCVVSFIVILRVCRVLAVRCLPFKLSKELMHAIKLMSESIFVFMS